MLLFLAFQPCLADNSDPNPLDAPTNPDVKPLPQEFAESFESTIYQHGPWTLQLVSHQQPLEDFGGQDFLNIFYTSSQGTALVWKSEEFPSLCLTNSNLFYQDHIKDQSYSGFWKDESGNETGLAREDITGGKEITIFVETWNGAANGGSRIKILRLIDQGPGKRFVQTIFSNQSYASHCTLKDLDYDGSPEIITRDCYSYCYSKFMYVHCSTYNHNPTLILSWDQEKKRYYLATNQFLKKYWERTIKRHGDHHEYYKRLYQGHQKVIQDFFDPWQGLESTSENIELAWERIFLGAKHIVEHWQEIDLRYKCGTAFENMNGFGFDVLCEVLTWALWGGKADQVKALLKSAKLQEYDQYPGEIGGQLNKSQWWQGYFSGLQTSPYWSELCDNFPQLEQLHEIEFEEASASLPSDE